MTTYSYETHIEGMKIEVEVLSVDAYSGQMTMKYRELISERVGRETFVHEENVRIWRRKERGQEDPWEMQATDGSWHFMQKHEVSVEVRQTWIRAFTPIKRGKTIKKERKFYVDVTSQAWREKFNQARLQLN